MGVQEEELFAIQQIRSDALLACLKRWIYDNPDNASSGGIPQLQIVEFYHLADKQFTTLSSSRINHWQPVHFTLDQNAFDQVLYSEMEARCNNVSLTCSDRFPPLAKSISKYYTFPH